MQAKQCIVANAVQQRIRVLAFFDTWPKFLHRKSLRYNNEAGRNALTGVLGRHEINDEPCARVGEVATFTSGI